MNNAPFFKIKETALLRALSKSWRTFDVHLC